MRKKRAKLTQAQSPRTQDRRLVRYEKRNLESIRESPPDLFLIDLTRLPSHGREVAGYLRRLKATRHVPILFVDGDADRVSRTRSLIPDADFAKWEELKSAIPKAKKRAPAKPVVPGTMAGYSGTPLPKKLGIREKYAVVLSNPPDRFERKLEPLPAGVEIVDDPKGGSAISGRSRKLCGKGRAVDRLAEEGLGSGDRSHRECCPRTRPRRWLGGLQSLRD